MSDYAERIKQSNQLAQVYMDRLQLGAGDKSEFLLNLKGYLLAKYMLDADTGENNLYRLAILSIKQNIHPKDAGDYSAAIERVEKYDCHETNSALDKKVLFIMNVERQLNVMLDDDKAAEIVTIEDLVDQLYPAYCAQRK